jgi:hypothetical protein
VPYLDYSTAINYHPASHLFVATLWNQGSASWGPQGVYFTTSPDFIHWSKPELAMTQNQMLRREPEGNWSYQYFSLIDPQSADSSYMTITDRIQGRQAPRTLSTASPNSRARTAPFAATGIRVDARACTPARDGGLREKACSTAFPGQPAKA